MYLDAPAAGYGLNIPNDHWRGAETAEAFKGPGLPPLGEIPMATNDEPERHKYIQYPLAQTKGRPKLAFKNVLRRSCR